MMLMEMSFVTVKFWKNGNSDVMLYVMKSPKTLGFILWEHEFGNPTNSGYFSLHWAYTTILRAKTYHP